jgi:hypothetical protein
MTATQERTWLAVSLVVMSMGCKIRAVYYEDQNRAAVAALETLHRRLNAGELEAIYADTAEPLHSRPKGTLLAAMQATRARWGRLVNAEIKSRSCFPNQVRFLVQAHFEKGDAGEMVVWAVPEDKALLQDFQMFPGTMPAPTAGAANECKSGK